MPVVKVARKSITLSNLDKVLYPSGFTKARGDRLLPPHRRRCSSRTSRAAPSRSSATPTAPTSPSSSRRTAPPTARRGSTTANVPTANRIGGINYCLINDAAPSRGWPTSRRSSCTRRWPRRRRSNRPTMMVFDLDPGPPADIIDCCRIAPAIARRARATSGCRASRRRPAARGCTSTCRSTRRRARSTTPRPSPARWRAARAGGPGARDVGDDEGPAGRARSSSTGARTTSTRRRCAPTRCGRAAADRFDAGDVGGSRRAPRRRAMRRADYVRRRTMLLARIEQARRPVRAGADAEAEAAGMVRHAAHDDHRLPPARLLALPQRRRPHRRHGRARHRRRVAADVGDHARGVGAALVAHPQPGSRPARRDASAASRCPTCCLHRRDIPDGSSSATARTPPIGDAAAPLRIRVPHPPRPRLRRMEIPHALRRRPLPRALPQSRRAEMPGRPSSRRPRKSPACAQKSWFGGDDRQPRTRPATLPRDDLHRPRPRLLALHQRRRRHQPRRLRRRPRHARRRRRRGCSTATRTSTPTSPPAPACGPCAAIPPTAATFAIKYADRLLFARDYYGGELLEFLKSLDLPRDVADKIYFRNAEKLVPKVMPNPPPLRAL